MSRFFPNTDPDEKASASDFETDVVNFSGGQLVELGTDRRVQKIDRIQTCRQMGDQRTVRPRQSDQIDRAVELEGTRPVQHGSTWQQELGMEYFLTGAQGPALSARHLVSAWLGKM